MTHYLLYTHLTGGKPESRVSYDTGTEPSLPVLDPHRAGTIYIKEFDGDDGYSSKIYDEPVICLCLKKT